MEKHLQPNMAIIGSGRVATSLGLFLISKGISISGIHSRNKETGTACAELFNCPFHGSINELDAELILVAASDDQTISIINEVNKNQNVVYTAGSVELSEIEHPKSGVFYPLQTFSSSEKLEEINFPVLIETKSNDLRKILETLCQICGIETEYCTSEKRKEYHLVAVFINNFMNHIAHIAKTENTNRNLNWNILKPLLDKTISNILNNNLLESQTGPASRSDNSVISKHESMLSDNHLEVYKALTESIKETMKSK